MCGFSVSDGERFYRRIFVVMTTSRMLAVTCRRQLTCCSRQLLFTAIFIVIVASNSSSVNAAGTATAVAGPFHLVAVLPSANFTEWTAAFHDAVSTVALQDGSALRGPGVALSAAGGVRTVIDDVCDAVERHNVSAMVVVGDRNIINTVLVVARHLGVPLLGYNDLEQRSAISRVSSTLRPLTRDSFLLKITSVLILAYLATDQMS